jgi:hypothetical protein
MSVQLTQQQMQVLGMGTMKSGQREAFLERLGKMVFDSALVRLLETLNDEQIHALNHALEANESYEGVMQYLQITYPRFMGYIQEVQEQFVRKTMMQTRNVV